MAGQITATSTTDSKEDVQKALSDTPVTETPVEETPAEGAVTEETPAVPAAEETPTPVVAKAEAAAEDDDDEDDDEPPVTKPAHKDRVGRLKWQRYQLKQENERLQRELAMRSQPQQPQQVMQAPVFSKPKPNIANFETIQAWTEALTDWTRESVQFDLAVRDHAASSRIEADSRSRADMDLMTRHTARVNEFKKVQPDFDAVAQDAIARGLHEALTPVMNVHLMHSDMGPQLMYHLAKHPEDVRRIAAMNQGPALAALGRLEGQLERAGQGTAPASTPRPTPKPAPRPITPVGSSATSTTGKHPDQMSTAEFKEWRRKGGGKAPLKA